MKSSKRTSPKIFRPFSNPTPKVRDAWSRLATTLSAGAFSGFVIVSATEPFSLIAILKLLILLMIGVIMMTIAIYVLKGADHV